MIIHTFKAFIGYVGAQCWRADAQQPWVWMGAQVQESLGQRLVLRTGRAEAKTRDDPLRIDGDQQAEAFVPSQPFAEADVDVTSQPTAAPTKRTGTAEVSSTS